MKEAKNAQFNAHHEVNLKMFFQKILQNKWFFIVSIGSCLFIAILYLKFAKPKYEASTSILIDVSGSSRALGDSKYVDGGVGLIDVEKNLYNEIGIIKSFSLMKQTIADLDLNISYYKHSLLTKKECYGYYPFEVKLDTDKSQLYGLPFEVEIISKDKYKLTVGGKDFTVSNPINGSTRQVSKKFKFSKEFRFDESVAHDYFSFCLVRPEYNVLDGDFKEEQLSFTVQSIDAIAGAYASKLTVGNIDIQASIFKISSSGAVVEKEIKFLKKLTENYVQSKLTSRNNIAIAKENFIKNQLKGATDSLKRVELVLEKFKKEKRALNLSETATNALGSTSNLQMRKAKIRLNIKYYTSLIKSIEENRKSEDFAIPTATGIDDPLINENILELKRLYDDRSKKKFYVTNTNQEMDILNKQIEQSTNLLLSNLNNSIKSSQFSLQRVDAQLTSYDGVIDALPNQENELLSIQRQSALYENLFNYLSQELAKNGIAVAENTSDTRVLDEARMVGFGPISPQKSLVSLLALIVGTLIPMVWIVLFSSKDSIENVEQILANCDIPVIASIVSHDSSLSNSKSDISLWKFKESFRDLSTNLRFVSAKEHCVLGITSIMPEEGKTYNAINLGITFAEAGKKTLIIDADLRNPSLVDGGLVAKGKGLSNYLQGETNSIEDIIHSHKEVDGLKFIPTSTSEGNVHELLSGSKMEFLIKELKEKFDYIIIDTPAVGLVSDFTMLSDYMDINLFIVRRKIAKIKFLEDLANLIPSSKKKSFIIFNDVPQKDYKYGYEEKYGKNREEQLVNKSLSV